MKAVLRLNLVNYCIRSYYLQLNYSVYNTAGVINNQDDHIDQITVLRVILSANEHFCCEIVQLDRAAKLNSIQKGLDCYLKCSFR
jgi:hypothetical protein